LRSHPPDPDAILLSGQLHANLPCGL
jgi:hypothetical protein